MPALPLLTPTPLSARSTNGSQFFVSLRPCPHLAGKHVVFGKVVKGFETIVAISKMPVDDKDRPLSLITISHCGELERKAGASSLFLFDGSLPSS